MGDSLTDKRIRIRHSGAILGCVRRQVNECKWFCQSGLQVVCAVRGESCAKVVEGPGKTPLPESRYGSTRLLRSQN